MSKAKAKAKVQEHDEVNEGGEAKGTKRIVLNIDGEEVSRADYIRREWQAGKTRGQIAKDLTKLQGKPIPYQIVFAATKGVAGGPKKDSNTSDESTDSNED